ncbi:MAG TPA: hypothetical protein VNR42_01245 [Solirubrobacteraceae bacterium]|nr:hypothetical protein [Solirubrobacteraceae bacterium]
MSDRRTIPLEISLHGRRVESETTCVWAGPYVLVIATVLPAAGLAVEVHSTFVGHEGVPTLATHLTLGPVGHAPVTITAEHERANLDPTIRARACAYEHAQILIETLTGLEYRVAVDVPDDAFGELERVER